MNLLRRITVHHKRIIERIIIGVRYEYSREDKCWGEITPRENGFLFIPMKKYSHFKRMRCGNHDGNSFVELMQMGIIVDDGHGVATLSSSAQKQFGSVRKRIDPKKPVKMSRTRAARIQEAKTDE